MCCCPYRGGYHRSIFTRYGTFNQNPQNQFGSAYGLPTRGCGPGEHWQRKGWVARQTFERKASSQRSTSCVAALLTLGFILWRPGNGETPLL